MADSEERHQKLKENIEEKESLHRSSPSARVIYKAVLEEGEDELGRPTAGLVWSGLAAGLAMGFSMLAMGVLRHAIPDTPWRHLLVVLGYPVGFLFVILGRQQLFTENTLTVILPLLQKKDGETFLNVLRLWAAVLLANMVGVVAFAVVAALTPAFKGELQAEFSALGHMALEPTAGVMLLRACFAGWLIALMVWLLPFSESARIWIVGLVAWLIG